MSVHREIAFFEEEMTARHGRLVTAVEPMLHDAWRTAGPGGMLQFVARIEGNEQQVRIRWVWLDDTADNISRPAAPPKSLIGMPLGRLTSIPVRDASRGGLYCSYYPVELGDGRLGALEMSESLDRRDEYIRNTLTRTVLLLGALIVTTGILVAIVGLRMIAYPLLALIQKTQQVANGNLRAPVTVRGSDELAQLAAALNQMCEKLDTSQQQVLRESAQRLEAMEQLRHGDRLKTVGRLASGVAHELGTPLNVVSGRAGLIASGHHSEEEIVSSVKAIQVESTRMTGIVQQLLNFARRSKPKQTLSDLNSVIERTVSLMEPIFKSKSAQVSITERLPDGIRLNIDVTQIQQVFSNLLVHAILSKEDGVSIQLAAQQCHARSPDASESQGRECVRITVTDNGDGIAGLEAGMVIKKVGQKAILSVNDFQTAMKDVALKQGVLILVQVGEATRFVVVKG